MFFCRELLAGTELVQQERMKQAVRMRDDQLLKSQPLSPDSPSGDARPQKSDYEPQNYEDDEL